MGLWSRVLLNFRVKSNAALDKVEDPREVMDYAYGQHQELLRKVRQGLIEVATSKHLLGQQSLKLSSRVPQMDEQARRAIAAGREDLARIALQRKQTAVAELEGLDRQIAEVADEERRLTTAQQQLSVRIEEFRTHRGTMSARYAAAEAQVRVHKALSGVSGELAELTMALGRAEEKTEAMLARASAIEALTESGALGFSVGGGDIVERELRELAAEKAVEEELNALKAQMNQEQTPPAS